MRKSPGFREIDRENGFPPSDTTLGEISPISVRFHVTSAVCAGVGPEGERRAENQHLRNRLSHILRNVVDPLLTIASTDLSSTAKRHSPAKGSAHAHPPSQEASRPPGTA